ncbi:MAG: hypothetical protein WAM14_13040 [Candidatus Nitrosopolaris sp.]
MAIINKFKEEAERESGQSDEEVDNKSNSKESQAFRYAMSSIDGLTSAL